MDIITDFASGIDLLDLHAFGLSNHSVVNLNVGTFQGNSTANNFFVNGPTTDRWSGDATGVFPGGQLPGVSPDAGRRACRGAASR